MELSHTRCSGLTLEHIEGFNVTEGRHVSFWQHRDETGRQVGPCYPTRAEALADTSDYAARAGWMSHA